MMKDMDLTIPRILVIDDNATNLGLIAEHLEEAKKRARAARLQANRASSCGACWQSAPMSEKTLAVA